MLGRQEEFTAAPFFWTQQYGKSLRYAGHAEQWDTIIYHRDIARQDFLAFYVLAGRIATVAGIGRDTVMLYITELLSRNKMPDSTSISPEADWTALAESAG
jgi:hypothetical protein